MFKSAHGLLMFLVLSSTLASNSYAAVGIIAEQKPISTTSHNQGTFADHSSFNALSAANAAGDVGLVDASTAQTPDDLFQINKKGLGNFATEPNSAPATFSSAPASPSETWTMLLVGALLVVYQLQRKQRGLMAPSLVAA